MTLSYVYACVFLAQKIHISENAKEALDEIGSYHIVFRDSMAVKVSICLNANNRFKSGKIHLHLTKLRELKIML